LKETDNDVFGKFKHVRIINSWQ